MNTSNAQTFISKYCSPEPEFLGETADFKTRTGKIRNDAKIKEIAQKQTKRKKTTHKKDEGRSIGHRNQMEELQWLKRDQSEQQNQEQ